MGLVTYTGRAREGHTGCEATEWESETSVRCMVTHGARGTRRLVMTVGEQGGGSVTQGWSADVGALSVMRGQNAAGTGSASVTVHGASMGLVTYTGRAREGHTGCEATEWESETSVRCMVTHGARGTRRLVMTVGEQGGGSVTQGWSADVGALSVMRGQNAAGTGKASVTVHGASMGLVTYTGRAREGHTGCEATEWESETSVRCMVTHGARGTRRLVMTVGEQGGGSVTQGWSADVGALSVMRWTERCGDREGVGDGARGEHGACDVHGTGSGGAHGMRGDGVGVGDIGEVHGDARGAGDTAAGDDGGGAGRRERDAGVVGGRGGIERDAWTERCGDRVGVGDGARGEHGACDVHGTGSGGAHGMRGDGVGVGDIGEVHGDARGAGDTAAGDDGGGAGRRERDAGVVGGRGGIERDAWTEPLRGQGRRR